MDRRNNKAARGDNRLFDFAFFARVCSSVSGDFSTLFALDHEFWDD